MVRTLPIVATDALSDLPVHPPKNQRSREGSRALQPTHSPASSASPSKNVAGAENASGGMQDVEAATSAKNQPNGKELSITAW